MSSKLLAFFLSVYTINLACPIYYFHFSSSSEERLDQDKNQFAWTKKNGVPTNPTSIPLRHAVAQFVDSPTYMYGVYSVKRQMDRFNMTAQGAQQIVLVPNEFQAQYPKEFDVLTQWLGAGNIRQVDKMFIQKLDSSLWKGTFNKLWMFNLTEYDKVIVLDSDILIRTSLMHWFDYPTPIATQSPDDPTTWNSGAMVISPNATIFQQMMDILPEVKASQADQETDTWTGASNTDQDFLSSFLTSELIHPSQRMKTLPSYASVISSKVKQPRYQYAARFRRHAFETLHFTSVKPWKKFGTDDPILCDFLREWNVSVEGMEHYYPQLEPLQYDNLRNCPKVDEPNVAV